VGQPESPARGPGGRHGAGTPFPYFPKGNAGDTVAVRRPFGRAFSLDAVHPSAATHKLIANALAQAINNKYNTRIPAIP